MKFTNTKNLILYMRSVFNLRKEPSSYGIAINGINRIPELLPDFNESDKSEIIKNIQAGVYWDPCGMWFNRFPISNDENKTLTHMLDTLISSVENDIDDKDRCNRIIKFIQSTDYFKRMM